MNRPRIGITTGFREGTQRLDHAYVLAIEAAGGLPIIAPMTRQPETAAAFVALLDGLLITGGPAIRRGLIGTLPSDLAETDPVRVASDEALYAAMGERPVLGICYGMQFINAQAGGTIYADVTAQRPGTILHSADRGARGHTTRIVPDSALRAALGVESLFTNTYHVQAVESVGQGLRAVAFSSDGVIEAVESEDGRRIGVQFHPERMLAETLPLFRAFIARCRAG